MSFLYIVMRVAMIMPAMRVAVIVEQKKTQDVAC
jgi:hypothetical protein